MCSSSAQNQVPYIDGIGATKVPYTIAAVRRILRPPPASPWWHPS
uniref:Uncharacterized protein n=1 Tax=Anopheles atroparvus TaxID=41427 RepID=A0AAG5CSZ7_ANOAO